MNQPRRSRAWDRSPSWWRNMGHRGRTVALGAVIVVVLLAGAGVALTRIAGKSSSGAIIAHPSASHDTVMNLHDGAKLVIPAGALPESATVTATYVSAPATAASSEKSIGTPVQITIESASAILHPIELDWPLPKTANALAARFGVYRLGEFDTSTRRWSGVETSYDPSKKVLSAQIAGPDASSQSGQTAAVGAQFVADDAVGAPSSVGTILRSLWSTVQEVTDAALSLLACVPASSISESALQVIRCVATEFAKSNAQDVAGAAIAAVLPKSCVAKLITDQVLSAVVSGGIDLVASPLTLLVDIAREPACRGGQGFPPPTVTGISPASGPVAGGNNVTINGTPLILIGQVSFGGTPAYFSFDFKGRLSANDIVVTAPAHAAGTVDVRIRNGGGSSPISPADQYTYR